jgi:hypothetical protein
MTKIQNKIRYARKAISSSCLLNYKSKSWILEVINISVSGIFLSTANNDSVQVELNDLCVLEIIFSKDFKLRVDAEITRISNIGIGFKFINFPMEKQIPLWELLGSHVDYIEK